MNGAVRSVLIRAATLYVRQFYDVSQVLGVLDETEPAVVGDGVMTWYVEVLTAEATDAIGVDVTLDVFGEDEAALVEEQASRLKHLYPDMLPWLVVR
jgi:hypothetical protein